MAHLGFGDPIKQYPGQVQVTRAVKVLAPGKHFNNLTPAEAKQSYWVVATEYRERYAFEKHVKAWGAAHKGPGVRFVAEGDALDDPDNKGFWLGEGCKSLGWVPLRGRGLGQTLYPSLPKPMHYVSRGLSRRSVVGVTGLACARPEIRGSAPKLANFTLSTVTE